MPSARLRAGLDGVIDSLLAAQHVLEMFRRTLPHGRSRACLDRLSNRLTKILGEARKLRTPENGQRLSGYAEQSTRNSEIKLDFACQ